MTRNNFAKKDNPFKRLVLLAIVAFAAIGLAITACSEPEIIDVSFITVTKAPEKTTYAIGDSFKKDGMVVTAVYTDGSKKSVTGYSTSGFDSATEGLKTITVTFEGKKTSFNVTISAKVVATPRASLRTGEYFTAQTVTLSTATEGATIRYTLDGTTPTASSAAYSGEISISGNTSLRAIAFKEGWIESAVLSADYFLNNLTADKWADGNLLSTSDEQWFKFTATDAFQRIYFTPGTASQVYVQVLEYDSLKTVPSGAAYNSTTDRTNITSSTSFDRTLVAGKDYFIRITYFNTTSVGTYKIAFTAGTSRPNMTIPANVTALTPDTWVNGNIPVKGGEQWYKFTAQSSITNTNYIHFLSVSMLSARISVYTDAGEEVGSESTHNHTSNFNKLVPVIAGNTYYFRVLGAGDTASGTYKISFNTSSVSPKITIPAATALTEGTWADGNFTETVHEQWYSFNATAVIQYIYFQRGTLTTTTYYEVYDKDGERIHHNHESAGISTGFNLQSIAFTPGTAYYIRVFAAAIEGSYKVGFSATNKITVPANATELYANTWTNGVISDSGEEQWFKFKATKTTQYLHYEWGTLKGVNVTFYDYQGAFLQQDTKTNNTSYYNIVVSGLTIDSYYYIRVLPSLSETDTAYNSGTYSIGFTEVNNKKPEVVTTLSVTDAITLEPNSTINVNFVQNVEQWFRVKDIITDLYFSGMTTYGSLTYSKYTASGISFVPETITFYGTKYLDGIGNDYYLKITPSYTFTGKIQNNSAASEIIEMPDAATWVNGNIDKAGGAQLFRFTATSANQSVIFDASGTLNNVYVQLYNADHTTRGGQTILSATTTSVSYTSLTKGDSYFIKVWARDNTKTGTYKVAFNVLPTMSSVVDMPTLGAWVDGNINTASGEQWFKFKATADSGTPVTVSQYINFNPVTLGNFGSVALQLYKDDGSSVGSTAATNDSFSLTSTLPVGDTYYIKVSSGSSSGTFKIRFNTSEAYLQPPATAVNLPTLGTWVSGNITTAGGEQWFKFTATAASGAPTTVNQQINFNPIPQSTTSDRLLQLYNADGEKVVGASSNNTSFSTTLTVGDTYYIKVSSKVIGAFNINFDTSSAILLPTAPVNLTKGTWVSGSIIGTGEQWYKFTATADSGTPLTEIQYINYSPVVTSGSATITLYNSDGGFVTSSNNSSFNQYLTVGSTYYIKVSFNNTGVNTFNISFNTSVAIFPSPTAVSLTLGTWADGAITTANGYQWFKFTATAASDNTSTTQDQWININQGSIAPTLQLYNADGTTTNLGGSSTSSFSRSVTVGNTYYIRANSSYNTGTFKISFNTSEALLPPATGVSVTSVTDKWVYGYIPAAGGEQWFTFTATAATQYIHFDTTGTLNDVYVQLCKTDGTAVGSRSNLYSSFLYVSRLVTVGDTYLIKVWPYGSSAFGTYKIGVTTSTTRPTVLTENLTVGKWANGNITVVGSEQWFTFTASDAIQYIHFDNTGTLDDVNVQLYDSTGTTPVGSGSNLWSGALYTLRTVTAGETYIIKVTTPDNSSATGTYKIGVTASSTTRPTN